MGKNIDREGFHIWLCKETSLGRRSLGDEVSRASRVSQMIDILMKFPNELFVSELLKIPEYTSCSMTVRSQLKRAALRYRKFSL